MRSTCFQELVAESPGAVWDCNVRKITLEGELVLQGDNSLQLESGDVGE